MRLAEEYDAAQDRGEVATQGSHISEGKLRASDVFPPKEMFEARKLRDAERTEPGIVSRAIEGMLERGEEPTRAAQTSRTTAPRPPMPGIASTV